jgi:hypothetical protein
LYIVNGNVYIGDPDVIMDANATQSTEISRVAVRLPAFCPERPDVWFSQADAQFSLAGITNETTKFRHVTSQLDQRYAEEVDNLSQTGDLSDLWKSRPLPSTGGKNEAVAPGSSFRRWRRGGGARSPSDVAKEAPGEVDRSLKLLALNALDLTI